MKRRIGLALEGTARRELRGDNIIYGRAPDPESNKLLKLVIDICVHPMQEWTDEALDADTLGHMTSFRQEILDTIPLMARMLNALSRSSASHYCFDPKTQAPCCHGPEDVRDNFGKVMRALVAMLKAGSANPSLDRWFTVAWRLRSLLAGCLIHSILPRAWQRQFSKEILLANGEAAKDDAAVDRSFQAEARVRHRRVSKMLDNKILPHLLTTLLVVGGPIERLHFRMYCGDVARKSLQTRKQAASKLRGHDQQRGRRLARARQAPTSAGVTSAAAVGAPIASPAVSLLDAVGHELDVVDALVESHAVNFSQMQHLDLLEAVGLEVEHLGDDTSSGLTLDQAEPPARSEEILSAVELEANRVGMGPHVGTGAGVVREGRPQHDVPFLGLDAVEHEAQPGGSSQFDTPGVDVEAATPMSPSSLEPDYLGLLSELADDSPEGLRASVHRQLEAFLHDDSTWALLSRGGEGFTRAMRRAVIIQQSGDFHFRFDAYYDSLPNSIMKHRQSSSIGLCFEASSFTFRCLVLVGTCALLVSVCACVCGQLAL